MRPKLWDGSGCPSAPGVGAPEQHLGGVELEWSNQAACLSAEPVQFFPVGTADAAAGETASAKLVCAGCEVQVECRDYALETRQPFGVWGGLDEQERRAMLAGEVVSATG